MAIKIYPYRAGSRSARALANALGGRVLRTEGSRYRYAARDTVINWGSSNCPHPCLNSVGSIRNASNKLSTFTALRDHCSLPRYWVRREEIPDDAFPIVCRTILTGHSGAGIVIANSRVDLVDAPLYVEYVRKQDEYRVHIGKVRERDLTRVDFEDGFRHEVIAIQRKARNREVENPNWQVRNHANGFIFVRNDVNPDPSVIEQAKLAIYHLGLDFGAVDIIWNAHQGRAYVLEVNTACGLEGQTVEDYARFFRGLV